jgi:UDP-N-acetylglucosamine 4,6-dehydratase/5-epimerase
MTGQNILVTGASGSFGHAFVRRLLDQHDPARVVVFSRDEWKQSLMARTFSNDPRLRFFLGDVRDVDRLRLAFHGVDVVVHAAALKQVPACERSVGECKRTNVDGSENVLLACLSEGVKKAVILSTDKSPNAATAYGASKSLAERLFCSYNSYSGNDGPIFAATRYGNVLGSRGSVVPIWQQCVRESRPLEITNPDSTRFLMTIDESVDLVLLALEKMRGGEVFVPKLPSCRLGDLADAVAGMGYPRKIIGLRGGEKVHECLISEDESHLVRDMGDYYRVLPAFAWKEMDESGDKLPMGFKYTSNDNGRLLGVEELKRMCAEVR